MEQKQRLPIGSRSHLLFFIILLHNHAIHGHCTAVIQFNEIQSRSKFVFENQSGIQATFNGMVN